MNLPRCVLIAAILAAAAFAQEDEPAPIKGQVQLQFVPPPMEGTISLGVYDKDGKLVRVVKREAATGDFTIGLNGLITYWDGKDDAGKAVPQGKYHARGMVVGDLLIEGEAFHGNDWITDESSPRLRRILNLHGRGDGSLVLLAENTDGNTTLVLANPAGELTWNQLLPGKITAKLFAANTKSEFFVSDGKIVRLEIPSAQAQRWSAGEVKLLSADDSTVVTIEGGKLRFRAVASGEVTREEDAGSDNISALAIWAEKLAGVRDGKVVLRDNKAWHELELDSLAKAEDVSFSPIGTLWVVDHGESNAEVKEYSMKGEFLRRLGIEPNEPVPRLVSAAGEGDLLFLLEEKPGVQRVRGLKLVASEKLEGPGAEAISRWQVTLSRQIISMENFGKIAPVLDGFREQETLKILPRANPLTPQKTEPVRLRLNVTHGGTMLVLDDGLPLRMVAETAGLKWAVLGERKGREGVFIIQSDGAVAEEYLVRRAGNLMSFDCGDFDYPEKQGAEMPESELPLEKATSTEQGVEME